MRFFKDKKSKCFRNNKDVRIIELEDGVYTLEMGFEGRKFYYLHQLQNIYFEITGKILNVSAFVDWIEEL